VVGAWPNAAAAGAAPNPYGDRVYVATANVENLLEPHRQNEPRPGKRDAICKGDWRDLVYFMRGIYIPDVFMVQQLSPVTPRGGGQSQVERFRGFLEQQTGQRYRYVISEENPREFTNAPCSPHKKHQANAIFFRTPRFERVASKKTWVSKVWRDGACKPNNGAQTISRTTNVYTRLRDNTANGQHLTVQSIHWPSGNDDGGRDGWPKTESECVTQNASTAMAKAKSFSSSDLQIFAGDTNARDWHVDRNYDYPDNAWKWWRKLRFEFSDAIDRQCISEGNYVGCRDRQGTTETDEGFRRRDYIWARRNSSPAGVLGAATPEVRFCRQRSQEPDRIGGPKHAVFRASGGTGRHRLLTPCRRYRRCGRSASRCWLA